MRKLEIGLDRVTDVFVMDEPDPVSKAYHVYEVKGKHGQKEAYAQVSFQDGPIKENGFNGCHNEDLIAIVIDRLQCFQTSEFSCRENAIALTKLEESLLWLNKRTNDRIKRGVEGQNIK